MSPQCLWLCLLFLNSFVFLTAAQLEITNPSTLSADGEIKAGTPFVISCNADAVNLDAQFQTVTRLRIQRQLHGSETEEGIVDFNPYYQFGDDKIENIADGRDWKFSYSEPPQGNAPINTRSSMDVKLHIDDARCDDAGIYQCMVNYNNDGDKSTSGQQNLTSRAAVRNMFVSISPQESNLQYTENDNVTITCNVEGPRNLQMTWRSGSANFGNFQDIPTSEDIDNADPSPVPSTNDNCDSMRYRSTLSIQLTEDDDGSMFLCIVRYAQEQELSRNLTLSISPAGVLAFISLSLSTGCTKWL